MARSVTKSDFEKLLPQALRDQFWNSVADITYKVFGVPQRKASEIVERYRGLVEKGPVNQQINAYHEEPLKVAADLVGVQITSGHLLLYRKHFAAHERDQEA